MEILRKKEFEEDRLFQNFHEMILYHMRQMQQCLTTAGKMFCDHNDEEETCEKRGRDVVESVILKECVGSFPFPHLHHMDAVKIKNVSLH